MHDPFKTEENLLPAPHSSFAGHARKDGVGRRAFAAIAKLWQPRGTTAEPAAATVSRYSLRLIDRVTGRAYSAEEMVNGMALARIKVIADTSYGLLPSDSGWILSFTAAGAVEVGVHSTLPAGFNCAVVRKVGTAGLTLNPGSGVTLNGISANYTMSEAYNCASLLHFGDGDYMIKGDAVSA